MADDENTSETALISDDFLFLGKEVDENGENLTKSAKEIKDYATAELSETVKQHGETIQTLTTAVNSFADVFNDVTKPIEEEKTRAQEEEQKLQSALDTLNADAETENSVSAKIKTALDDTENRVFSAIQDAKTALEETHSTDKQELSKSIETLSTSTNQSIENLATTLGVVQIDLKNEITNRRNAINELSAKIGGGSGGSGLSDLTLQDIITIEMTPEGVVKDDSIFLTELNSEDSHVSAEQIKEYIDAPTNAQFAAESVARQNAEKTLQENIDSEAKRAQDAENTESEKREKVDNDLQSQIDTLNADAEISGSVKNTVSDAIAKVISDAPERLDTLKEIADWISTHENDASAMNSALVEAKNAIIGETKRAQDAEAVLKESIDSENKERIKAIEEEAKERIDEIAKEAQERIDAITALQMQAAEIADNATTAKTTATKSAEKVDAMGEKLEKMQETIDAIPFTEEGLKDAIHKEAGDNLLGEVQVLAEKKTISFAANSWTSTGVILPKTANIALVQIQSFNSSDNNIWNLNMTALVPLQASCNDNDYTIVPLPTSTSLHAWNANQSVGAFGIGVQLRKNSDAGIYKSGMHLVLKSPIATTLTLNIKMRVLM